MGVWYLYIVQCRDETLYTGITTDIKRRIKQHNSRKGAKALLGKLPTKLVYSEQFKNRSEASKREVEIKDFSRACKIELIIRAGSSIGRAKDS